MNVNGAVTEGDGNVQVTATSNMVVSDSVTVTLVFSSGTAGKFSCRH